MTVNFFWGLFACKNNVASENRPGTFMYNTGRRYVNESLKIIRLKMV